MRVFALFVASWALGVTVYWVVGSIVAARPMGTGNLGAAALYSGVMFAITAPALYLPTLWWLNHFRSKRATILVITGATLIESVVATALVFAAFGGFHLGSLVTHEALMFYLIFGTAGAVLSIGYRWFGRRATSDQV